MKKTKWLVPSLVVVSTPIISLASCSNACIEWDSRVNPTYTYRSQKLQTTVTSYDDATNKFFENITPFIICDDATDSIYKNFYLRSKPEYILTRLECSKVDNAQHRISMKMYTEYKQSDRITKGLVEAINIPFELAYSKWVSSHPCWCVVPQGCQPYMTVLPTILKNDTSWKFIMNLEKTQSKSINITVDYKTTDEKELTTFANQAAFATTFMSEIPDPGSSI